MRKPLQRSYQNARLQAYVYENVRLVHYKFHGKKAQKEEKARVAREREENWQEMRKRMAQAQFAAIEQAAMSNKSKLRAKDQMRMKRLGLFPEKDISGDLEDELGSELHDQKWIPRRRVTSEENKKFTNLEDAPESVLNREYNEPDEPKNSKALEVAVIGRPNAGKSSIINFLLRSNVSAVSQKYNTTRERVLGVLTEKNTQITFHDTPGLIKPQENHLYVRSLVTTAVDTVESVDLSLLVVDAVKRLDDSALQAIEKILIGSAQVGAPTMLVMNKYDLVRERDLKSVDIRIGVLSSMIEEIYQKHRDLDAEMLFANPAEYTGPRCFKTSALQGRGIRKLRSRLIGHAVERPWNFHSSVKSTQSDLDMVTEIIRAQLFTRYNQELPYNMQQENVGWTRFKDGSIRIDQDIFVPKTRHVRIVIGQNGDAIRQVGVQARAEIEKLLEKRVHLYLNVRVKSG